MKYCSINRYNIIMSLLELKNDLSQLSTFYEGCSIINAGNTIIIKKEGVFAFEIVLSTEAPDYYSRIYYTSQQKTDKPFDLSFLVSFINSHGFRFRNSDLVRLTTVNQGKFACIADKIYFANLGLSDRPVAYSLISLLDVVSRANHGFTMPQAISSATAQYDSFKFILSDTCLTIVKDGKLVGEVTDDIITNFGADSLFQIRSYARFDRLAIEGQEVHKDLANILETFGSNAQNRVHHSNDKVKRSSLTTSSFMLNGVQFRLDSAGRIYFSLYLPSLTFCGYIKHGGILEIETFKTKTPEDRNTIHNIIDKLRPYINNIEGEDISAILNPNSTLLGWYRTSSYYTAMQAIKSNYATIAKDICSSATRLCKKLLSEQESAKIVLTASGIADLSKEIKATEASFSVAKENIKKIMAEPKFSNMPVIFSDYETWKTPSPDAIRPKGAPMATAAQPTILGMIIVKMAALLKTAGAHAADVGSDAVYRMIAEGLPDIYIEVSALLKTSKLSGKRRKTAMDKIRADAKDDELQRLMIKAGFAGFIKISPKVITDNIPGIDVERLLRELEVNVITSAGIISGGMIKDLLGPYYDALLFAENDLREAAAGIAATSTSGDNTINKIKDVKVEEAVPVA